MQSWSQLGPPKLQQPFTRRNPAGYATPSQRSFAPPKGMRPPEPNHPTHEGYETPAYCLRSARPAEAAIAKVFAKIRQKILFCKFFGRAGRTGTSRTTRRQNFSLERPLAVPKTSKKRKKKIGIFYDFGTQFFIIFDRFWRS